jgi:hypothetical protein
MVLLSPSDEVVDEEEKEVKRDEIEKRRRWRMYELLFKEDSTGNTPLHYAIKYWPKEIIFQLLTIGCGCSEKDMESIPPQLLEEFLNEHCITRPLGPDVKKDNGINFHFSFLQRKSLLNKFQSGMDKNPEVSLVAKWKEFKRRMPEKLHIKKPNITEFEEDGEFLHRITRSEKHCQLVCHPVIRCYIWTKWMQNQSPLRRYRSAYLLFITNLIWFVFDFFGGKK